MTGLKSKQKWSEFLVAFAIATAAAFALAALGLSEVSWAPFFVVAVESGRRRGCLNPFRQGARS